MGCSDRNIRCVIMNIVYIRAAVEAATGQRLKLKELRSLLLEMGLITKAQAKNMIFPGYKGFFPTDKEKREHHVLPVDRIVRD